MILLVSGGQNTLNGLEPDLYGALQIPDCVSPELNHGRIWAGDNGAFTGFNYQRFLRMLGLLYGMPGCKFISAPDVVGNAEKTFKLFEGYSKLIKSAGFPVALVAQDGLTASEVPWNDIDAIFIGGTTEYKESQEVLEILDAAPPTIWKHVGRVNSEKRVRHFYGRVNSIDGSGFSRFPSRKLLFKQWIDKIRAEQEVLPI